MPIRTILVPLDGTEAAEPVLETAFRVGRDIDAHIGVLHVRADPKNAVPLLGEGMSGAMIEEMIDLADSEAAERASRARAMFEAACRRHDMPEADRAPGPGGASAAWIEEIGREDEGAAKHGRLFDLSVVARPTPEQDVSSRMTLNACIRETGRPVLVVPPEAPRTLSRRVAIAWNGSSEAARAVAGAMTFLSRADEVHVITAEAGATRAVAAAELVACLAWHGIDARARTFETAERAGREEMMRQCAEVGADLLVMGAYTQSRVRRLILGGLTQHVLQYAEIPVLMAR